MEETFDYYFNNTLTSILISIGIFVGIILGLIIGILTDSILKTFLGIMLGAFIGFCIGCIISFIVVKKWKEKKEKEREEYIKKLCNGALIVDTCVLMNLGCFCEKCYTFNKSDEMGNFPCLDGPSYDYVNMKYLCKNDNRIAYLCKTAHFLLVLEKVLKQESMKIIIHRHVYQELQNMYYSNRKKQEAQRAKHLLERWQKLGLIQSYPDIEDKEKQYYADDELLKYLEQRCREKKNATLLTSDLDLRIRARDRIKSNATIKVISFEDICDGHINYQYNKFNLLHDWICKK